MIRQYQSLAELRQDVVEAFVRTAILIDNEPLTDTGTNQSADLPRVAQSTAYRGGRISSPAGQPGEAPVVEAAGVKHPEARQHWHQLSVRPITNAFADRKITCGFYFPSDEDGNVVDTAFAAAKHVDVTIVDWQLRASDTGPAKELIARLLKDDQDTGGRLRLIVLYTGERPLDIQCTQLRDYLVEQRFDQIITVDEGRGLRRVDALITFANKPAPGPQVEVVGSGARPIPWADLPRFVLEQYGQLTEGLLQAFALKSIGAVRDDTHHLLSVFTPDLDGAYLAQRAGISTPTDAEEMMTDILASEFATSIVDRGIDKEVLGDMASVHAIRPRTNPEQVPVKEYQEEDVYKHIIVRPKGQQKYIQADRTALELLTKVGLNSEVLELKTANLKKLKRQFFETDDLANVALAKFARLASLKREADGPRKQGNDPVILTGGIIVRAVRTADDGGQSETFLLCMQPGCDAVRLSNPTAFPFCKIKINRNIFDLVVKVDGNDKFLLVDRRPRNMSLIKFDIDPILKVVKSEQRDGKYGFWTEERAEFWEFVAELRALDAYHFTSQLVTKFNRVALNGSEWLRLNGNDDDD